MVRIIGLTGLRPTRKAIGKITSPPYDVIKPGTSLEDFLRKNEDSLYHAILGRDPIFAFRRLIEKGLFKKDNQPCFYVWEQQSRVKRDTNSNSIRTGVLLAAKVSSYSEGEVIRHEETFPEKVRGRIELRKKTGFTFGPVFCLTKSPINPVLEAVKKIYPPEYEFVSDFDGFSDLDGIKNVIFRIKENSPEGFKLKKLIGANPLYIADGHHRYQAALLSNQAYFLAYVTDQARILAYNRLINGPIKFAEIKDKLDLKPTLQLKTPPRHQFCLYSRQGAFLLKAKNIPDDVVGRLDVTILEKELYPLLGVKSEMIRGTKYIEYHPESELLMIKEKVDSLKFDLGTALHPVSLEELVAVADAGVRNPKMVMPEKSTYFYPKILTGIFIYPVLTGPTTI